MLRLDHVRKSFGPTTAVDDLSFDVNRGEVFGLLGPNGAGKSTTISMMCGLLAPDSGTLHIDGAAPTDPHVRLRLGLAPQTLALYDDLSGEENLLFFGRLFGLSGDPLRRRAAELLDLTQLADRRHDRTKAYSGGMKRRLNFAAALMHDPDVVFLDEPTAGVDPQSRNAIFDMVANLRAKGRTIVYTTHYMEEAQRLCDRIAIMDRGRLMALDHLDGLLASHGGDSTIVVERPDGESRHATRDPAAELPALLASGRILSLRVERPNLEGVFLTLTGRSLRD